MSNISENLTEMKKPKAEVLDVDLSDVNRNCVTYDAKVSVTNLYTTSIPICDISYCLKSNNREIATGTVPGSLKGHDTSVIDVALKMPRGVLLSVARDVGAEWEIEYDDLAIVLTVDLPGFGNIRIPVNSKGEIKLPTVSD